MFHADQCVLCVVDIQEKLVAVMHDKDRLVKNAGILIQMAQSLEMPILWCQQYPKALGETVEPLKGLLAHETPMDKFTFSCCAAEGFMDRLRSTGRKQVILCGIESHVCVYQTATQLLDEGFEVCLIADAVDSRTPENRQIGIDRMVAEGAYLGSTEMILFELLRTARHDKFKELSRLIR